MLFASGCGVHGVVLPDKGAALIEGCRVQTEGAMEINPNHPNLTIWHNKIDVCVFVGIHCHYANVALKIIRGGTDCYTITLCSEAGHEDTMISLRDVGLEEIYKITKIIKKRKEDVKWARNK